MPSNRYHSYSPEAAAILGKIPSWIVRWGVTVVAAVFVGILVGCYFIKYPDLVQAPVAITTINPPADLYARYDGLIDSICVRDGEVVEKGRLVAVLRNASDCSICASMTCNGISERRFHEATFACLLFPNLTTDKTPYITSYE